MKKEQLKIKTANNYFAIEWISGIASEVYNYAKDILI